jgi:hypothetical protein
MKILSFVAFLAAVALIQACGSKNNDSAPPPAPLTGVTVSCAAGLVFYPSTGQCTTLQTLQTTSAYTHYSAILNIRNSGAFSNMVQEMTGTAGTLSFCFGSICPNYNSAVVDLYDYNQGLPGETFVLSISPGGNGFYSGAYWNVSVPMTKFVPTANYFVLQQYSGYNYFQLKSNSGTGPSANFPFQLLYKSTTSPLADGNMTQQPY